jgi:hypothetical protein
VPPKGARRKERSDNGQNDPLKSIANLLGLLATKDMNEGDKIGTLSAAGFTNQEIAALLRKEANTVKQVLFQKRKRGNKPKKRKK